MGRSSSHRLVALDPDNAHQHPPVDGDPLTRWRQLLRLHRQSIDIVLAEEGEQESEPADTDTQQIDSETLDYLERDFMAEASRRQAAQPHIPISSLLLSPEAIWASEWPDARLFQELVKTLSIHGYARGQEDGSDRDQSRLAGAVANLAVRT
ncbi:unnamed protein product [Parajaminaea phylloscopi]